MRFLPNEGLYTRTAECLEWLATLRGQERDNSHGRDRCHLYWYGTFSLKQAFAVKSFLATQDLDRIELWLWLDRESGYERHEDNVFLRPLLPHIQVKRFDVKAEAEGTPVENRTELYQDTNPVLRSNLSRLVILFNYGGIYTDLDTMFLRDFNDLPAEADEFCTRWSAHVSCANNAFLRLRRGSATAHALLVRCSEVGSCRSRHILRFEDWDDLDLLVLPCIAFDPLWPHRDGKDRYRGAPFNRFWAFFEKFGWRFRRKSNIRSHRDFFPGAFAYHWHNYWEVPEHKDSYFGFFNTEFDHMLSEKLGIETAESAAARR